MRQMLKVIDMTDKYTVQEVTVTFSATIPTQPYGNVGISTSWRAVVHEGASAREVTADIYRQIHDQVVEAVQPIAERKVKGMEQALASLPKAEKEALIQSLGPVSWMVAAGDPAVGFAEKANHKE